MKTDLSGKWSLSGAEIKCDTKIPGDFHTTLIENGTIKDPLYGFNEQDQLWVGRTDWTISREFDYKLNPSKKSILEITEADTVFTVYINGMKAGNGQNLFARYRFDVTHLLKNGKNLINIVFESAEKKAIEINESLPYPAPTMSYDVCSPHRNLLRKCQCHGGWDWGPCVMVSGIYGDIFIEQVSDGLFDNATVNYSYDSDDNWMAEITASYESFTNKKKNFVFELSGVDLEKKIIKITQQVFAGKNKIKAVFQVKNPTTWKTAGELKELNLSENTLYDLKISESSDHQKINKKICFSTLKTISEKDFEDGKEGRSLYFENNGRRIYAKGSNWIPTDNFPSKQTLKRYEDLLKSAVEANQNCIRVWGGGIYEKDFFYELCDRYGLMVWQDCMFACSTYPMTEDFVEEVKKELDYQIPRIQSHPCIAIWCGNNENFGALDWFEESKNNKIRYLIDYDRLYNGVVGKRVKKLDPNRVYWPSSPCSGPDDFGDNWHSDNMGDMHYWSVWHEKKDKEAYMSIRPRFISEFGYESFPSLDCIKSFAEEKDYNFTSKLMEYHQRSPSGNAIILENFARYFRFPVGFENMLYLSQVQQAVTIKTALDYWRSLNPHCMGSIVWQLNDIWPGASWSSLEFSGKWKLLHYEEMKSFANVAIPSYIKDGNLIVTVCNDTLSKISGNITVNYLKFDGNEYKKSETFSVNADADSTVQVVRIDNIEKSSDYFITVNFTGKNDAEKTYNVQETIFTEHYKRSELEKAGITYSITQKDNDFEVELCSEKPAFFVSLDTNGVPGKFSTNMITILPGKSEKITFIPKSKTSLTKFKKALKVFDLRSTY